MVAGGAPVLGVRRSAELPGRRVLFRYRRRHQLLRRDQRARLLGAGDGAVHAVRRELRAAVLHQCHAECVAEVDRGVRRAVLGHDRHASSGPPACATRATRRASRIGRCCSRCRSARRRPRRSSTSSATDETTFNEFTGRFGFDLKPGWFDDSTLYAFYSRGYKAGGFNPPLDRSLPQFAGTPEVYEPEFVNAFEIGSKNVLAGGRVQANLTAFYYQYDASAGVEDRRAHVGERERRCEHLRAGRRVRVQSGRRPADRCERSRTSRPRSRTSAASIRAIRATAIRPGPTIKDISRTDRTACSRPRSCRLHAAFGLVLPADRRRAVRLLRRDGRERLAACRTASRPISTAISCRARRSCRSRSARSTRSISAARMNLTARADYYWRDDFYARIFNRPIDKIESWDVVNAQVELELGEQQLVRARLRQQRDGRRQHHGHVRDGRVVGPVHERVRARSANVRVALGFRF